MKGYEIIIGLEVHAELKTASKIFCSCPTAFGGKPNTHVCPVCLGLPGVLPVINREAIVFAIKTALALNCRIAPFSKFDRKNYYYPDLPKNYQISQYDLPLAQEGYLELEANGEKRRIGITRVHLEEDAGKLIHITTGEEEFSLVDYNRTGVPLLEIVSKPDLRSPEEARAYLEKLKTILEYLEVSDCKMEEGSLRCDANISVRPQGEKRLGIKTEVKNVNSFRALQLALAFELERQITLLEAGEEIAQETRGWDEGKGITVSLRGKEEAQDYRYFPEPDLVPLEISPEWVREIQAQLPELPDARQERLQRDYGLPAYDAGVLTSSKALADFFEACLKEYPQPKVVSNWTMGEYLRLCNLEHFAPGKAPLTPAALGSLLRSVEEGKISGKMAKEVFAEMFTTGQQPEQIIAAKGLRQIDDEAELGAIVAGVIAAHPRPVADYRAGKEKALGFLVGEVMKITKGKASPPLVNKLLKEKLQGEG